MAGVSIAEPNAPVGSTVLTWTRAIGSELLFWNMAAQIANALETCQPASQ